MRRRMARFLAAVGLGAALVVGGATAPVSAAPQVWYQITGSVKADCSAMSAKYRGLGARIYTGCHQRSYDKQWAFSYYWPS